MTEPVSDALALAVWQAVLAKIDAGGGAALSFYSDAYTGFRQAPNPAALVGTVLLAVPSGVASKSGIAFAAATAQAIGAGVPKWARLINANGEFIVDGLCGLGQRFELALVDGDAMYPGGDIQFLGGTGSF